MSDYVKVKSGATLWDPNYFFGTRPLTDAQAAQIAAKVEVVPGPPGEPGPAGPQGPEGPPGPSGGGSSVAGYDPTTPYLLRGTVSGHLWSGVTKGSGNSQAVREATRAGLQAAMDYAATNRKFFELEPGIYEIHGTGLNIPVAQGFTFKGSMGAAGYTGTSIVQFGPDTSILNIGAIGPSGGIPDTIVVDGVALRYGTNTAGMPNACGIRIGRLWMSQLLNIDMTANWNGTTWDNPPLVGILIDDQSVGTGFFSNIVKNVRVKGVRESFIKASTTGTGNSFENIYMGNGGASNSGEAIAITGPALYWSTANRAQYGNVWNQLNIEWTSAQKLIAMNVTSSVFNSVHLEGNRATGWNPCLIESASSNLQFNQLDILHQRFSTGTGMDSGATGSVFSTYQGRILASNVQMQQDVSGYINRPWTLYRDTTDNIAYPGFCEIDNFALSGNASTVGTFYPDATKNDTPRVRRIRNFSQRHIASKTSGAEIVLNPAASPPPLKNEHIDPVLYLEEPLTQNIVIPLTTADAQPGSTVVLVRTQGATGAFTASLRVGATDIVSLTTANTRARVRFNGTAWVDYP
mgnify:CR=1 FL=1